MPLKSNKNLFAPGWAKSFEVHLAGGHAQALEKDGAVERFTAAIGAGYVPPPSVIEAIQTIDIPAFQGLKEELQQELAPRFNVPLPATITVDENTTAVVSIEAIDPQGDALTYELIGADAHLFSFDAASGSLSFISPPDYEAPKDASSDNIYDVGIRVSDGILSAETHIAVSVADVRELPATFGIVLHGGVPSDIDLSLAPLGDVNGDGIDDILIGTNFFNAVNGPPWGEAYVVYGRDTAKLGDFPAAIDLGTLDGSNGFSAIGESQFDATGNSVSSAGDINGDGIDDILIGAYAAGGAGKAYIIYGRSDISGEELAASVDLPAIDGEVGFAIQNSEVSWSFARSVASAGDINGDGLDDILIGTISNPRHVQVIYGRDASIDGAFPAVLDVAHLEATDGFLLIGDNHYRGIGDNVSPAGDVNGDGIDDIMIGARASASGPHDGAGTGYVVFGRDSAAGASFDGPVRLTDLNGSDGFAFNGTAPSEAFGSALASAGDVNGDGIDDMLFGAVGSGGTGRVAVVFGRDTSIDGDFAVSMTQGDLDGTNGFIVNGVAARSNTGAAVSAAGDVNGDGIGDILIGAPGVANGGISTTGEAYILFGRNSNSGEVFSSSLNLSELDASDGFIFRTTVYNARVGSSMSAAGDINGDGFNDILVGAKTANYTGETYVIFGGPELLARYDAADGVVDGSADLSLLGLNPADVELGLA